MSHFTISTVNAQHYSQMTSTLKFWKQRYLIT